MKMPGLAGGGMFRIYDTFAGETTGTVRFVVGMTAIVEVGGEEGC